MLLDEAVEKIIDSIEARLIEAIEPDGFLREIKEVIRGDRSKPKPPVPALWIFTETANPQHNPTTLIERWIMPVVLAVVVKDNQPESGFRLAARLAARARSIVLKARSLGLREVVQDTRSGRYEAYGPWHREGSLYSAIAVLEVTFLTREGDCKR